jgi:hypothetical protein
MLCHFVRVAEDEGRLVVSCLRCGQTVRTRSAPERTYADCPSTLPIGAGDLFAAITGATGLADYWRRRAAAKGRDCGCEKRQRRWNRRLPFPARLRWLVGAVVLWRRSTRPAASSDR